MPTDTKVANLVLNVLTQEQYDAAEKNENELYLIEDNGTLPEEIVAAIETAANTALEQAKESGEFNGEDGYTPVKGTDYWTAADKAEMVNDVIEDITAADVGAFGVVGSIGSGADLNNYINVGAYTATSSVTSTLKNSPITSGATQLMVFKTSDGATNSLVQIFTKTSTNDNDFYWRKHANGSWSNWVMLATTDYAVNKAGDTMTGILNVNIGGNIGRFGVDNTNDYAYMQYSKSDGTAANLTLNPTRARYARITAANGAWASYDILHTGNKPSGSYTGNGSATSRTVDTKGVGDALLIYNSYNVGIITKYSSFVIATQGTIAGTIKTFKNPDLYFANGVLYCATADTWVNGNGTAYSYQVL